MKEWTERVEAFLVELSALSRKHGIEIGGCGCCGSPYLSDISHPVEVGHREKEEVRYDTEDWHYTVVTRGDKDSGDLEWEKEEA